MGRTVDVNKLVGKLVEGTSEIMNHISCQQPDFGRRSMDVEHAINVMASRRVVFTFDSVRVAIDEGIRTTSKSRRCWLARSTFIRMRLSLSSAVIDLVWTIYKCVPINRMQIPSKGNEPVLNRVLFQLNLPTQGRLSTVKPAKTLNRNLKFRQYRRHGFSGKISPTCPDRAFFVLGRIAPELAPLF